VGDTKAGNGVKQDMDQAGNGAKQEIQSSRKWSLAGEAKLE